ncbi:hypothetical protein GCM10018952_43940 [Streptosporangium vulgare]
MHLAPAPVEDALRVVDDSEGEHERAIELIEEAATDALEEDPDGHEE